MHGLNNTTVEDQALLMAAVGYVAAACVLFLVGFFGFFLNLFAIVLMWRDKELWTPLNVILFNLVCSDFSVAVLGNPWTMVSAASYGWIFGRSMCIAYGFFMSLLGITSITTLTVLAMERYAMVSRSFHTTRCVSIRHAGFMVAGIWLYSFTLTVPPLVGWGRYSIEAANISCSVNWEDRSVNAKTYIIYLFFFGLFLPLIVIIFSYAHIIRTTRKNKMRMGQLRKVEARIAYTILLMITAFLLAWTPYSVFALLVQFGDPTLITPATGVLPALLAKSSICYNPVIYVGLNSQFRQHFRQIIKLKRVRSSEECKMAVSKYVTSELVTDGRHTRLTSDKRQEENSNRNSRAIDMDV
ncbi:parapinopsin-like [Cylas formicarius]|uniref:parapinopsin-like n=1 Tax=Cylas formicarius TaxID=197179 RepID=UPI002958B547|nr:parapinopsin-like [Cylas formicarius]XP_060532210.1 parapinopsin-like [Cylas formicarius]